MIELVVIIVAGLVILDVVHELFQKIEHRRDERAAEEDSEAQLLDELRRQP